jgi:hypothetical protein
MFWKTGHVGNLIFDLVEGIPMGIFHQKRGSERATL